MGTDSSRKTGQGSRRGRFRRTQANDTAHKQERSKKVERRYDNRATIPQQSWEQQADRTQVLDMTKKPAKEKRPPKVPQHFVLASRWVKRKLSRKHKLTQATPKSLRQKPLHVYIGRCVLVILALVVLGSFLAIQSLNNQIDSISSESAEVLESLTTFKDHINSQDGQGAQQSAETIAADVEHMRQTTTGSLWVFASYVPIVDTKVSSAKELTYALGEISDSVITPLAEISEQQGSLDFITDDSSINLDLLQPMVDTLSEADANMSQTDNALTSLATTSSEKLNDAISKTHDELETISSYTSSASMLAPRLSSLLGASQAREYLLLIQDNSQLRSLGGIPLSSCILSIDSGKLTLKNFKATSSLGTLSAEVAATNEEKSIFGDSVAQSIEDIATIPDYPRAATLMAEAYESLTDNTVDGVIMIDATTLQRLVGCVGSVSLSDGTLLDEENTADYLLHDVATENPSSSQASLFTSASKSILESVLSDLGQLSCSELLSTLSSSASEGRILLWTSDADDETLLSELSVDGSLTNDTSTNELGVYLNDQTNGKIDWYLQRTTTVDGPTTNSDGSISYNVTTTLHNTLSEDEAKSLRSGDGGFSITGATSYKHSWAEILTDIYLIAPEGASITDLSTTGDGSFTQSKGSYKGREVIYGLTQISGDSTLTISYKLTCKANSGLLSVQMSPTGAND